MIRRVFVEDQSKVRTHHTPFSMEDIQSAVQEGRQAERARIITLLEGLREQYNLESMSLNEVRVAKYEALSNAVALVKGENK